MSIPYWQLVGLTRVFVSTALACKVFRMVLLTARPLNLAELDTTAVELMVRRAEGSDVGESTVLYYVRG